VLAAFTDGLAARMSALTVGPGYDPATKCGPMINRAAIESISGLVEDAVAKGARVVAGGKALDRAGFYFPPTVIDRVPAGAALSREEIFGPVAAIRSFGSEDEAVAMANDTEFGLVAYVYTGDLARGLRVSERIEAGMVGLNRGLVSDPAAPFGGVKQSGLGREGGHHGILEFCETKYIAASW
jgi:succinate-semialdehyde dehydrogenase/glutarate-semialdehyde dehydrogenase